MVGGDEAAFGNLDVAGGAGVGAAGGVAEDEDLGAEAAGGEVEQGDGSEAGLFVVWQVGAAGVDNDNAIAMVEAVHVGVAADHDIDGLAAEVESGEFRGRGGDGAEVVYHADAPAFESDHLRVGEARVVEDIVIAAGGEDGRELPAPIEHAAGDDVAAVEDEVNGREKLRRFGAEAV